MALFNKKSMTVEEISKAIANLSDEDKKKIYEQFVKDREDDNVSKQEHLDNDGQTAKDSVEEYIDEEQKQDDSDAETDEITEEKSSEIAAGESNEEYGTPNDVVKEEHHDEVIQAMAARLDALEAKVAEYGEIIEAIADLSNADTPIGASAMAAIGEADDALTEDDRIMRNYNPNWRRG